MVLPGHFRGMGGGGMEKLPETQQSGHASRSGPEIKDGRSNAKGGALERLGCRTNPEGNELDPTVMSADAARRILPFYPT